MHRNRFWHKCNIFYKIRDIDLKKSGILRYGMDVEIFEDIFMVNGGWIFICMNRIKLINTELLEYFRLIKYYELLRIWFSKNIIYFLKASN
jgi:hypothetical protein